MLHEYGENFRLRIDTLSHSVLVYFENRLQVILRQAQRLEHVIQGALSASFSAWVCRAIFGKNDNGIYTSSGDFDSSSFALERLVTAYQAWVWLIITRNEVSIDIVHGEESLDKAWIRPVQQNRAIDFTV